MADKTKDIWNDDDGEEERPKRHRLRGFLIFFLTLAAVLAVVLAAAWRDGTGLDALRRYVSYGKDSGGTGYAYDTSTSNRFAALGDSLAVLSETQLSVLDGEGETLWSTPVKMTSPAVQVSGEYAVAYDVGGTELYVLDRRGLRYSLTAGEGEPYISARVNAAGELAVTAQKHSYKGAVSVYDSGGDLRFAFNSSERFVTDACVTEDGKILAAVTLGQSGGAFASSVVLYNMTATSPQGPSADMDGMGLSIDSMGSFVAGGGMCLAIGQLSGMLALVCDDALVYGTTAGEWTAAYGYSGEFLREYALGGEDYAVLLLNRYRSGSVGRLVTVDAEGQERASLDVNQEILSVSAAGRYIAVLYADHLAIYNPLLEEYATLSGTDYAREALALSDGSALLLAADHAKRFLP